VKNQLSGRQILAAWIGAAILAVFSSVAHALCKPGDILVGEDANRYYCQNRTTYSACVRKAGFALHKERREHCAQVVGQCFADRKTPLKLAAIGCVVGCRAAATCAISCGIAGIGVQAVVDDCIDQRNACFELALVHHREVLERCKKQPK
jgi:hypothetical protein